MAMDGLASGSSSSALKSESSSPFGFFSSLEPNGAMDPHPVSLRMTKPSASMSSSSPLEPLILATATGAGSGALDCLRVDEGLNPLLAAPLGVLDSDGGPPPVLVF